MPSEKQSSTTRPRPRKRRNPRYFLDRNLGRVYFPADLRDAGLDVTAQDDTTEYQQNERDPWLFYRCGKSGFVVVTSDLNICKSFPHMAAIALGRTTVIAFTNNNYNSDVRARAFLKALPEIEDAIYTHRKSYFIGVVGMQGTFRMVREKPLPQRKLCDPRDWDSYERVCAAEGRLALGMPGVNKKNESKGRL